ncbi:hypothetical protein WJX72_008105 [[Myrmecia] bisecta]|uniref:von Hippel-Lindau disease tumour suppressor beta domain-containing protein n=1 Tax=[Myrmecia] bisecta TaxID=41462 RepID=A0AAW1QSS2_9CHLO
MLALIKRLLCLGCLPREYYSLVTEAGAGSGGVYFDVEGNLIKSRSSDHPTHVLFRNELRQPVRIIWLDPDGKEVAYSIIQPKAYYRMNTFCTHPWTFRACTGPEDGSTEIPNSVVVKHQQVIYPRADHTYEKPMYVVLRAPEAAAWTPAAHLTTFPRAFHRQAKTVLLCHQHLRSGQKCQAPPLPKDTPQEGPGMLSTLPADDHEPGPSLLGTLPLDLIQGRVIPVMQSGLELHGMQ